MEHRLCSPSRTYIDMPVVRKVFTCKQAQSNEDGSFQNNNFNQSNQPQVDMEPKEITIYSKQRNPDKALPQNMVQPALIRPNSPKVTTSNKERTLVLYKGPRSDFNNVYHQKGNSCDQLDLVKPSTSKDQTNIVPDEMSKMICLRNQKNVAVVVDPDSDLDSDSDSHSSVEFCKNERFWREPRLSYTGAEDEEILKFVLRGNNISRTSSILLWKELESIKKHPKRTYQSLKNRYLRNIKPNLLSRFRYMLSTENIKMLKKRYPELRKSNAYLIPDSKKYPKIRMSEKCVIDLDPPAKNATNASSSKDCDANSASNRNPADVLNPSGAAPKEPCLVTTLTDAEVCDDRLRLQSGGEGTSAREDKRTEGNEVLMNPETSYSQAERLVHIFAREKLENVPVQTFKYYEKIGPFSKKAAVDLKLFLSRSEDDFPQADLPISVSVTVTVGREEANDTEHQIRKRSYSKTNCAEKNTSLVKKPKLRKKRRTSSKRYVLKVKSGSKKLKSALPWYMKVVDGLLKKVEQDKKIEEKMFKVERNSPESQCTAALPLDNCTQESVSQSTNCSTDDESCYTQTLKKISDKYRVEMKQTPDLLENEEGKQDDWISSASESSQNRKESSLKTKKQGSLLGNMLEMAKSTSHPGVSNHSLNRSPET